MGVPLLMRNLTDIHGRLPFKITFNTADIETDINIDKYAQLASRDLQYIGIDGSVFIHSKISSNFNKNDFINGNAKEIVTSIIKYIKMIVYFFNIFSSSNNTTDKITTTTTTNDNDSNNNNNNNNKSKIIIHFVIDGNSPCLKNRRMVLDEDGNFTYKQKDEYAQLSEKNKTKLHEQIYIYLKEGLKDLNNDNNDNNNNSNNNDNENKVILNKYNFCLLSNHKVNSRNRGEGELELYKFCKKLNSIKKQEKQNVIISSDSDLLSLMLMHQDKNLVLLTPISNSFVYITNYNLVTKALEFESHHQILKYVFLHFVLFGSDYNLGLMSNPNIAKQRVIHEVVKRNNDNDDDDGGGGGILDIDIICGKCVRKRKKIDIYDTNCLENNPVFLEKLKLLLIYEALCSFLYYFNVDGGSKYLLEYSPRLYEKSSKIKYLIPYLQFSNNNNNNNNNNNKDE